MRSGGRKQQLGSFPRRSVNCHFLALCLQCLAEAGAFGSASHSGHKPQQLFELRQTEKGKRARDLRRSLRATFHLHFKKKGDPDDPLPLIMRCIRVDTAAGDFHIKPQPQDCCWPSPVSLLVPCAAEGC